MVGFVVVKTAVVLMESEVVGVEVGQKKAAKGTEVAEKA